MTETLKKQPNQASALQAFLPHGSADGAARRLRLPAQTGTECPEMKQEDAAMIECRDLVAVSPIASRENTGPASSRRLSAAFLTQLIATAKGHPQTRERRRVASEEASRLYATAQARPGRRSLRLGSL